MRIAADCKADAVKFQKRTIHELLTRAALEKPYVNRNSLGATYGEHRLKLELSEADWYRLRDLATGLGLEFMGSAWDRGSADLLDALDTPGHQDALGGADRPRSAGVHRPQGATHDRLDRHEPRSKRSTRPSNASCATPTS